MTSSAKEVLAAAILDDARAMGALAGGLPIERRLATAILAALDAAGYVVVPNEWSDTAEKLREAAEVIDALVAALDTFVSEYVELVNSGDAGFCGLM